MRLIQDKEHNNKWSTTIIILLLFILPLMGSGAFALLANLTAIKRSFFIYLGQFLVSVYLIKRCYSFNACGIHNTQSWYGAGIFLLLRLIPYVTFIPIVSFQMNWQVLISQFLYYLIVVATAEELHFRGLLYSGIIASGYRPFIAAIISSFLFGLLHLSLGQPLWIPLFIADGLAWCAIRYQTNSIYPCILSHGVLNFVTATLLIIPETVDDFRALLYVSSVIIIDIIFFSSIMRKKV